MGNSNVIAIERDNLLNFDEEPPPPEDTAAYQYPVGHTLAPERMRRPKKITVELIFHNDFFSKKNPKKKNPKKNQKKKQKNPKKERKMFSERGKMILLLIFTILWVTRRVQHYCMDYIQTYEGSLWNDWQTPSRTKTKDLFISLRFQLSWDVHSVWAFNSFLNRLDRKRGKKSTSERSLNVTLTPSSTSLRVKTAIPCVLSLDFEKRGE